MGITLIYSWPEKQTTAQGTDVQMSKEHIVIKDQTVTCGFNYQGTGGKAYCQ